MATLANDMLFYFNNNLFMSSNLFDCLSGSSYVPVRVFQGIATYNERIKYNEKTYKQIRKYSKIARKYDKLPSETRRQLAALFDASYRYPRIITVSFNSSHKLRAGLALFHAETLEELLRLCASKQKVQNLSKILDDHYLELEQVWSKTI